ncbi:MAG: acetyl-CoA carboxylase biotin carboxyl carrier protein [Planctomycetota bacterium]
MAAEDTTPAGTDLFASLEWLSTLVQIMNDSDLAEVSIKDRHRKVRIRKPSAVPAQGATVLTSPATMSMSMPTAAPAGPGVVGAQSEAASAPGLPEGTVDVESPMVGTFYRAPSPEASAFVNVGDGISVDATICIIEAMKVMNEIKAEIEGTIVEILVSNGEAVEYGQPLFRVKKTGG